MDTICADGCSLVLDFVKEGVEPEARLDFELEGAFEADMFPCFEAESATPGCSCCCCWLPIPPGTRNPFCFVGNVPVFCPVPLPTQPTGNVLVRRIPRNGGYVDCERVRYRGCDRVAPCGVDGRFVTGWYCARGSGCRC